MKLNFPNPSRCFDPSKNHIQFWGYDTAMQVSFFVEEDALQKLCPQLDINEAEVLAVFDKARIRINEVANEVYQRGSKGAYAYSLAAEDF